MPLVSASARPARLHPRSGGGGRGGGLAFCCERTHLLPRKTRAARGLAGFPSLTEKGEQPLFPKMTCDFAPEPVRTGADLCAGFWGRLKAAGAGVTHLPTHLSFLFASSSFQLRPPWGLVQPRVPRLQCPGLSSAPYLPFQSGRRAEASPASQRAQLLVSAFPEVLAVPGGLC